LVEPEARILAAAVEVEHRHCIVVELEAVADLWQEHKHHLASIMMRCMLSWAVLESHM